MIGVDTAKPLGGRRRAGWARAIALRTLIVVGAVIGVRMFGIAESQLMYFPSREKFVAPRNCEDVRFFGADGLALHGWFVRAADAKPGEKRPVVLHCHGNAGNVSTHLDFSEFLTQPVGERAGVHVFLFDYRGYGRSDNASWLTRAKLMADTRAAFAYVRGRADVDSERVGVLGVSLGGAFALKLASEVQSVKAVCTLAGFSSWSGVAGDHVPILGPILLGDGLKPATSAAMLKPGQAYLVVHGTADTIVPPRHAAVLEAAAMSAGVKTERVMIDGVGHNEIAGVSAMRRAVREFFSRELGLGGE